MNSLQPAPIGRPRSAPQRRILDAALELFAAHGVSGTSLQMIADAIGVTKAAVYHQFRTKDEIVIAVTEDELATLEGALEAAEAQSDPTRSREILLASVVEVAVRRRRLVSILQSDPVIVRLLTDHDAFGPFLERLFGVLMADDFGPSARVATATMSAAIGGTVVHPFVVDVDDETLTVELMRIMRRVLALPE